MKSSFLMLILAICTLFMACSEPKSDVLSPGEQRTTTDTQANITSHSTTLSGQGYQLVGTITVVDDQAEYNLLNPYDNSQTIKLTFMTAKDSQGKDHVFSPAHGLGTDSTTLFLNWQDKQIILSNVGDSQWAFSDLLPKYSVDAYWTSLTFGLSADLYEAKLQIWIKKL